MDIMPMFYTGRLSIREKEYCEVCEEAGIEVCCDKCGDGVCRNERCCMVFPHYKNTEYVVCGICKDQIEKKLKQEIDLGKLTLLKRKIATNTTIRRLPIPSDIEPA
jgi:hypothetical protein